MPDYRVDYLEPGRWNKVGTIQNTSATDWLKFSISTPPSLSLVQTIRVIEDDLAEDDILEEVFVSEGDNEGKMFKYQINTVWSFNAGVSWFGSTAFGKAIFTVIGLVFILALISTLSF